ncbi:MAG: fluoride efflux transporter CrcB [Pyrinomonadaceae bacterium]
MQAMTRNILFVAIGGMLGSVGRFVVVSLITSSLPSTVPFGTFFVNVVGCFGIGAAMGIADRNAWFDEAWLLFLTAGVCGGFTTFSAFALENVGLLQDKSYGTFAAYGIASFVVCIVAALAGLAIFRG